MQTSLTAVGGALKLGFFVSGLTVASLAARFATADTTPGGHERAELHALAAKLDGRLSESGLRALLDAEDRPLFARFDPGLKQAPDLSAVHAFEGPAPNLHLFSLPPSSAQLVNASLPLSLDPNPPARPFVLKGSAEDRATAVNCLAQAVYYEAGFEPAAGEEAVAQVVLNRMRHPIFPHSVCGVVYQGADLKTGCQFSFTCDGSLSRTPQKEAWDRARYVAEHALNGYVMKGVGGATHYHTQWVVPWWQPSVSKVAQVGAHIFYRWPGALGLPGAFTMRYAGNEHIAPGPTAPALEAAVDVGPSERQVDNRAHMVLTVATDGSLKAPEADAPQVPGPMTPTERLTALARAAKTDAPAAAPAHTETVDLAAEIKPAALPDLKVNTRPSVFGKPRF